MNRTWLLILATMLLPVAGTGWIVAQEKPQAGAPGKQEAQQVSQTAAAERPQDEQAIRAASQAFAKAFEAGDEKAIADHFTEQAEYIDEGGEPVRGREALANAYEQFFAQRKEIKAESKTDAVRFLGPDTAIEEGTFTVTAKDSPPVSSRFSALHVRHDGKWLIALLKEWSDETAGRSTPQDLAWMIGTWESEGDELSARTTYQWAANKAFIRAQYTITPKKGGQTHSGVQVIGVDPAVGYIRAWLFASDGGIGESIWFWEGDGWMIESVGTLADGSATTAVNFLRRTGDDEFIWRSVQRTLAGEPLPDIAPVKVKRAVQAGGAPHESTSSPAARQTQEFKP